MPLHDPVNPVDVHRNVALPALTGPLTVALPVQRGPRPVKLGPENVNVPLKAAAVAVPVIVPFQSEDAFDQLPLTEPLAWVSVTSTARGSKLDDSSVPVQLPAMLAGGVGDEGVVLPAQAAVSAKSVVAIS